MIGRILSHFTRPDPVARAERERAEASEQYACAREELRAAKSRSDTRRIHYAERTVFTANTRLMRAERAYEEARA